MSQYMNFYVKGKNEFIPIGDYSRSTEVYRVFKEYGIYGKATRLTDEIISHISLALNVAIKGAQDRVNKINERKTIIASFNNDISEKIEMIQECDYDIKDIEEQIEALKEMKGFVMALENMTDYSLNRIVWFGIEVENFEE